MIFSETASEEVRKLLDQITEGATSNKVPLGEVLRLCMRLAKQLHNEELLSWALAELNGYKVVEELPNYRIQSSQVFGHFSGPFNSGLRNAPIPQAVIDESHRDSLFTNYMMEPIAELEKLTTGGNEDALHAFWPADAIAYYQSKEIYQGMVLSSAWRIMTKSSLLGILDTVRTRILEFALRIESEIKIQKSAKKGEKEKVINPSNEKVSQIIQNTIYGGTVSVGNIGPTTQQTIQVQPGDLNSLKEYLHRLGLSEGHIQELDKALTQDENADEQPGPATSSWLSRIMIMIGRGSLSLASNAAGSLIASGLMKYLGLG